MEFAEILLDDTTNWNRKNINEILNTNKTKTVYLNRPITVLLIYWTAFAGDFGEIHFRKDIYKRDQGVLAGIEQKFKIRKRHLEMRKTQQ